MLILANSESSWVQMAAAQPYQHHSAQPSASILDMQRPAFPTSWRHIAECSDSSQLSVKDLCGPGAVERCRQAPAHNKVCIVKLYVIVNPDVASPTAWILVPRCMIPASLAGCVKAGNSKLSSVQIGRSDVKAMSNSACLSCCTRRDFC